MEEVFKKFNSSENGLSAKQAEENRIQFGTNELKKQKKKSFLVRFLLQFKNLMVLVLLASAIISLVTNFFEPDGGNIFEAVIIFIIVIANALIGVFQERKAENSIELLQKSTAPLATVIRDGKTIKLETTSLVCGDIVLLKSGDVVPADLLLLNSNDLKCNESSLTGESISVDKDYLSNENNINKLYNGTFVTNGNAKGIVIATGENTELGKIAQLIRKPKKEKTPLEKNIDQISKIISIFVISVVIVVFAINLIFSKNSSFLDSFLTAIALAVAAIPESLPAVVTIIMALGVEKLAKHGAIIKNLNSVETLGCCNIICTDKTGTLTENKMQVQSIWFSNKTLSSDSLIEDKIFINCLALSNNTVSDNEKLIGDATEISIYKYIDANNDIDQIRKDNPKIEELPFNSNIKRMSSLHDINGKKTLIVKGAYDYLIKDCSGIYINGKTVALNGKYKELLDNLHHEFASKGERVIAYAYKKTKNIHDNNLCFVCLVGIIDPPKKEVKKALDICKNAHIKPIMITGDHPDTALAIAKTLEIAKSTNEVLTGEKLDRLQDEELRKIINQYSVFARVSPIHKNRIVNTLKNAGNIVAMAGDGANDAPSIKSADIGVSMGKNSSDVTKSVADLVITDDNYESVVLAATQGRTIYSNLRKTLQFLISTNIVEVLCIFIISLIMPNVIFLLPVQILFINLITDSLPAFALGLERPEKEIMTISPRKRNETLLSDEIGTHTIAQGFIQSLLVLVIFILCNFLYGNAVASTMIFLIICFMQIIHAINCKTNNSIFSINIFNNKVFNISFVLLFLSILAVALFSPLQILFGIVKLNFVQWLIVALSSVSIIPLVEFTKIIIRWFKK